MTTWTQKVGLRKPTGPLILNDADGDDRCNDPDFDCSQGWPMSAPFCVRCTSPVCVCGVGR